MTRIVHEVPCKIPALRDFKVLFLDIIQDLYKYINSIHLELVCSQVIGLTAEGEHFTLRYIKGLFQGAT